MREKTWKIAYTALFAAMICVLAPFSIPIGDVPLSLATFAVYMSASVGGCEYGTAAVTVYIALGAVGLPAFSGFTGGAQRIIGLTGGFILGYIPCAAATGFIVDRYGIKKWAYPAGMITGTLLLYGFGAAWFIVETGAKLMTALTACVFPFLLGDAAKIAAVSVMAPKLRVLIKSTVRE